MRIYKQLDDVPVALATLGASVAGLLFNIGFFAKVGVRFIPLFSLGEHLVFSLTFALYVAIIGIVALAFHYFAVRPLTSRAKRRAERREPVGLREYVPTITLLLLVLAVAALFLAFNAVRGLDGVEFGFLGLLALTVAAFFLLVRAAVEERIEYVALAAAGALLVSFGYGYFYASASFWENRSRGDTWALLKDGTEYTLARGGERWALLVDGDTIFARPVDQIITIEHRD